PSRRRCAWRPAASPIDGSSPPTGPEPISRRRTTPSSSSTTEANAAAEQFSSGGEIAWLDGPGKPGRAGVLLLRRRRRGDRLDARTPQPADAQGHPRDRARRRERPREAHELVAALA